MRLRISSCPNDIFIFDAIMRQAVETEGMDFEFEIEDIENLNNTVLQENVDISKISIGIYPKIVDRYQLLTTGFAVTEETGPLLVAKNKSIEKVQTIAVPGFDTTAAALIKWAFPQKRKLQSCLFSKIPELVLTGKVDAGVIIHETRFLYQEMGLTLLADLGELWTSRQQLPIALGGIVVNRRYDIDTQQQIERILKRSVAYSVLNAQECKQQVRKYAQELDTQVIDKHIDMFVNKYTLNLGEKGKKAVIALLKAIDNRHEFNTVFVPKAPQIDMFL